MTSKSDLLSTTMQTSARVDYFKTSNALHLNASLVQEPVPITHPPANPPSSLPLKHGQSAPNPRSTHRQPPHASFRRLDYPLHLHHVLSQRALIPIKRCSLLLPQVAVLSLRQNPAVCEVRNPIRGSSLSPRPLRTSTSPARLRYLR
jgi:hypothetical protein